MTPRHPWRVVLSAAAEADFAGILRWTAEQFGPRQAHLYADTLSNAIAALTEGPHVAGAGERSDIAEGILTLHVARAGRKGRHLIVYRIGPSHAPPSIEVLRLLHDSMDLPRHLR